MLLACGLSDSRVNLHVAHDLTGRVDTSCMARDVVRYAEVSQSVAGSPNEGVLPASRSEAIHDDLASGIYAGGKTLKRLERCAEILHATCLAPEESMNIVISSNIGVADHLAAGVDPSG